MADNFLPKKLWLWFALFNVVLVLVLFATAAVPPDWHIFPGHYAPNLHSTGFWLFASLVFLMNVLAVLFVGFIVIFPVLLDGIGVDERRITRLLKDREGIPVEALDRVMAAVRTEAQTARRRIALGRAIILAGAVALVFAFTAVCVALVDASPRKPLFVADGRIVANETVTTEQLWRFTGDQIAGAIALDIPELYDFHFGTLDNNVQSRIFTDFVFAFRAILGWVSLTSIIVTLRDWRSSVRR